MGGPHIHLRPDQRFGDRKQVELWHAAPQPGDWGRRAEGAVRAGLCGGGSSVRNTAIADLLVLHGAGQSTIVTALEVAAFDVHQPTLRHAGRHSMGSSYVLPRGSTATCPGTQ